jgi:DNA-binding NarL/FixJ family response regulator
MIRLLIADDQALVRGAIAALLGLETDIEVVAEVGRGDEVLAAVLDPALAAETLATGESPLTERETDVLRAASSGGRVAWIAQATFLSEGTVRNYLSSAMGKTGARTRAGAVRAAEENGWLL